MKRPSPFISCVVPAFNEAENLKNFIPALSQTLLALNVMFEIIIIDDGSSDDSIPILKNMVADYPLVVLELSRNFGKEAALTAGLDYIHGNVALFIDADFQHPLDAIPSMLHLWQDGYDMVYGIRSREDESTIKRWLTTGFYQVLNKGSKIDIPANAGDFRLMDIKVIRALQDLPERNRYMKGLYAWVGFKSIGIQFTVSERQHGKSSFKWGSLLNLAISGITAFSDIPLRLCAIVGAILSFIALAYGSWIVVETLIEGVHIAGWATIVAGMAFLGGLQLLFIGVLGEYVARIYNEVKARPKYIVANQYSKVDSISSSYIHDQQFSPSSTPLNH